MTDENSFNEGTITVLISFVCIDLAVVNIDIAIHFPQTGYELFTMRAQSSDTSRNTSHTLVSCNLVKKDFGENNYNIIWFVINHSLQGELFQHMIRLCLVTLVVRKRGMGERANSIANI